MKRNIAKVVSEYDDTFEKNGEGKFYASDYYAIYEMSQDSSGKTDIFRAIDKALAAGFMIGYRHAKKEARKQKRQLKTS